MSELSMLRTYSLGVAEHPLVLVPAGGDAGVQIP